MKIGQKTKKVIQSQTKKLFKVKKCPKNAKKLKICSLKIHKGTGIFKKNQNLSK